MKYSLIGAEGYDKESYLGYEVSFSVLFCLEVRVPSWDPWKRDLSYFHGVLTVVHLEDIPPRFCTTLDKLSEVSQYCYRQIFFTICR